MTTSLINRDNVETATLNDLYASIWAMLVAGADDRHHPYHTAALASIDNDRPDVRTVVLRSADERSGTLLFHTDRRSDKVDQIQRSSSLAWMFYDPDAGIQLRVRSTAEMHTDGALVDRQWDSTSAWGRRCYCVQPGPGEVIGGPLAALPQRLQEHEPNAAEQETARAHFAVIECHWVEFDWLLLHRRGHSRARFEGSDTGWTGHWVVP